MNQEPFKILSVNNWNNLKNEFKSDWPRGMTGYYALDNIERWLKIGLDYGFRVLNPFGEAKNGMVFIVKDEKHFIEMLIECPQNDTQRLADALKNTKLIDWHRNIVIHFPQKHVFECLKRIADDINMNVEWVIPLKMFILDKKSPLYNVCIPHGYIFKLLSASHIDIVNSTWPHRYPGSEKYFQLLTGSKSGYGLFKEEEDQLISFGFVKAMGALGHLYTLEENRRQGFGEIVTKLICNDLLKSGKDVFSFVIEGNVQSYNLHKKLGFTEFDTVFALELQRKMTR